MIGIEVTGRSNGEVAARWRRDQLITSYDFTMPFAWKLSWGIDGSHRRFKRPKRGISREVEVMPNSRNTWEMIYT